VSTFPGVLSVWTELSSTRTDGRFTWTDGWSTGTDDLSAWTEVSFPWTDHRATWTDDPYLGTEEPGRGTDGPYLGMEGWGTWTDDPYPGTDGWETFTEGAERVPVDPSRGYRCRSLRIDRYVLHGPVACIYTFAIVRAICATWSRSCTTHAARS